MRRLPRGTLFAALPILLLGLACQSTAPPTTAPPTTAPQQAPAGQASPQSGAAAPAGKTAATAVPTEVPRAQATIPTPAVKAVAQASPTAAAAKVEPKGKVVVGLPLTINPSFLDPLVYTASDTPFWYGYLLHEPMLKDLPGPKLRQPALAESYEIAPDLKSATFKLREGVKFHNGEPVTSSDVKFTFEKYQGGNASILHDKTDRVETPDARTVRFVFKDPFLDFLAFYGGATSAAGWIIPQKYYEQVGPDGFKKAPIGAGPYKFVRLGPDFIETEANTDYWRKVPSVKTIILRAVPDSTTRLAALKTSEIDLGQLIPSQLIDVVRQDPQLTLASSLNTSVISLEFPGFEKPDSQFHDKRVRQAVSLALDRQALSEAEVAGLGPPYGNWMADHVTGALKVPVPKQDVAKAKQLLAEAGYPNGFDGEQINAIVNTFDSLAERVLTQLRPIGIQLRLNAMDQVAYNAALLKNQTPDQLRGIAVSSVTGGPGNAASRIESLALCNGSRSPKCLPEVDAKFAQYKASVDSNERDRLITEIQQYLIDEQVFVPLVQSVFFGVQGPRIANDPKEIWSAIPFFASGVGPYEDIRLKE